MVRNSVQTVTTPLPVLVEVDSLKDADGRAHFLPEDSSMRVVRVVRDTDLKKRLRTIFSPKELPLLIGAIQLKQALGAGDGLALHQGSEKVRPWLPDFIDIRDWRWKSADGRISMEFRGKRYSALLNYIKLMADMFQSARLVIWFSEKEERLLPALYCPDWKTAAFVVTFTGRLRVCPKCSEIFIPSADNVDYCSPAHREAHRVARWRSRQPADKQKRKVQKKSLALK
jgi:hypothetical protein